ncbi:hypothetical protein [Akkermansia glycaniphila]|uniref:Uncharacterized protein n=1 Tax=Akkermansia glycaniphila TaxID=1679444 RepID=A0A1C7PE12_9BACT|nr:hypothetical protein [Akkermansia glycaniphila]OCA03795.1 hypothetical protein AC781_02655 [Akkermansia glycaniphila]SEH81975.1 Hypothetical protein PYTT_0981 [Akkermansia glycaniphila]
MKTTLIFSSITGLIFLPSCVCNTSGKLDTVGKTQTIWCITEKTHLYSQNNKYYIKGEACIYETTAHTINYLWKTGTEPNLANTIQARGTPTRGYHQISISENANLQLLQGQTKRKITTTAPISFVLTPDTPWIPAATFEHTPFRTIAIPHQKTLSRSFSQIDPAEMHRTNGNILRTPLVAILFIAVDIPCSVIATMGGVVGYAIQQASK